MTAMSHTSICVLNDNNACVCWSKSRTTKDLRHITIRENAVRESVQNNTISVHYIIGSYNIADIFTKELKDTFLFLEIQDVITSIGISSPPMRNVSE